MGEGLSLGQQISHYRLVEKIGEGGMGVVWRAEDTVLGRSVAIKLLPADAALDENRRKMFLDEARLASSVSDARIVQVYELGREGDLDFIVMELVEGKPLNRILHGRPLPPDKVAAICEQVARALSRAHRKGLIHRDLKPANILVTPDGDVKVVDFGLATLLAGGGGGVGAESLTLTAEGGARSGFEGTRTRQPGAVAGTVPYMSPEQARGETLDLRSDIFSLGSVLYEMTTGQRPFIGSTTTDVLKEIVKARPVAVHDIVPKVPLELDRIIQKALAPRRSDRYQTMEDLAIDLRRLGLELESGSSPSYESLRETPGDSRTRAWKTWLLAAAACIGLAGLLVLGFRFRDALPGVAGARESQSLLILPLEVRGQQEGADYVGRAFAEALAANLAAARNLKVLPVPAALPVANADPTALSRVARASGASRLLTGSLTRRGDSLAANLSLLDAAENRLLWGKQLVMRDDQMTALASALARAAAERLGARLKDLYDVPQNIRSSELASSPLASDALGALQRHEIEASVAATTRLAAAFPESAEALALRVEAYREAWHVDMSTEMQLPLDRALAALARIDPDHPLVEVTRGYVESGRGHARDSIPHFTKVLARDDLSVDLRSSVLGLRGFNETIAGDHESALRDLDEALLLTPTSSQILSTLANSLRTAGRPKDAVLRGRQAIALSPADPEVHLMMGFVFNDLKQWEEAVAEMKQACDLEPNQVSCAAYAISLQGAGRTHEALAVAERAGKLPETTLGLYNLACFWARSGNGAEALRQLRHALDRGYNEPWIADDPDLTLLHGDPRFRAIVEEVKKRAVK